MANQLYTLTSPSWDGSLNTKFVDIISPTTSFSGTDIVVSFAFDDSRAIIVGTLATMTYSLYREKRQVRTLGRISPRGVTKGPMTVAGTLVFSVINQHVVNDIRNEIHRLNPSHPIAHTGLKRIRMDELPPFDIILTFGNEYGQSAKMIIYGVTITDEAMTFSIEDMFTENVMTYMARDIETMRGPFSPDMSMYVQSGTDYGSGQQLPKYGFDPKNLWNQTLDAYQQRVKALVDKANRDYGSSYNAPDYSGVVNLSPSTYNESSNSVCITVYTKWDTTDPAPGIRVGLYQGDRTLVQTTDNNGKADFTILLDNNGQATFELHTQNGAVTELSNPGSVTVTSDASYQLILAGDIIGPMEFSNPPPNPAVATVTTEDFITRISESFAAASNPVLKDIRWTLSKIGVDLNEMVHTLLEKSKPFFKNMLATIQFSFSTATVESIVDMIKTEIKTKWPAQIKVFAGALVAAALTDGISLVAEGVGVAATPVVQWLLGILRAGGRLALT